MHEAYALELKNITKTFPGVKALDSVSLKVRPGSVHALMGENGAGKSTLMKCLFGIYEMDAGEVFLRGKKVVFNSAKNALESGVSMIHQELMNVPERSVMENVWIGREPYRKIGFLRLLDHTKMRGDTADLMRRLEMAIDPDGRMGDLSISLQQTCEIARAVSYNASVVVMDEPTSSLSENETAHLFRIIDDLRKQGVAIVYISHRMGEIFQIADEVSIMRDGAMIGTFNTSELTEEKLIRFMVGRDNASIFPFLAPCSDEVVLKVESLTSANPRSFKDVSFELRKGEILGIGGLVGAQRTELVEAIFGLRGIVSGKIFHRGAELRNARPRKAIGSGIAMLTEDRRGSGIFPLLSITTNTAVASLKSFRNKFGLLQHSEIREVAARLNQSLRTKTPTMETLIQDLSGGNQQKVLISRWLMTEPDIFIMDEPTRGIDVGAKFEIYTIIAELVKQGKSIIMVSSEMTELIGMSHRIMVLCNGKHTGTLSRTEATQERIMRLAALFNQGAENDRQ